MSHQLNFLLRQRHEDYRGRAATIEEAIETHERSKAEVSFATSIGSGSSSEQSRSFVQTSTVRSRQPPVPSRFVSRRPTETSSKNVVSTTSYHRNKVVARKKVVSLQYVSPYILEAERKASNRIKEVQLKNRKKGASGGWNENTKPSPTGLFDPNLKKQEIFKLQPRTFSKHLMPVGDKDDGEDDSINSERDVTHTRMTIKTYGGGPTRTPRTPPSSSSRTSVHGTPPSTSRQPLTHDLAHVHYHDKTGDSLDRPSTPPVHSQIRSPSCSSPSSSASSSRTKSSPTNNTDRQLSPSQLHSSLERRVTSTGTSPLQRGVFFGDGYDDIDISTSDALRVPRQYSTSTPRSPRLHHHHRQLHKGEERCAVSRSTSPIDIDFVSRLIDGDGDGEDLCESTDQPLYIPQYRSAERSRWMYGGPEKGVDHYTSMLRDRLVLSDHHTSSSSSSSGGGGGGGSRSGSRHTSPSQTAHSTAYATSSSTRSNRSKRGAGDRGIYEDVSEKEESRRLIGSMASLIQAVGEVLTTREADATTTRQRQRKRSDLSRERARRSRSAQPLGAPNGKNGDSEVDVLNNEIDGWLRQKPVVEHHRGGFMDEDKGDRGDRGGRGGRKGRKGREESEREQRAPIIPVDPIVINLEGNLLHSPGVVYPTTASWAEEGRGREGEIVSRTVALDMMMAKLQVPM